MKKKIFRKRSKLNPNHRCPKKEGGTNKDCSEKGFKMVKLPHNLGWSNQIV
jgi:hypothetical protein